MTANADLDDAACVEATPGGLTFFFVVDFADAEDVGVRASSTCTLDFVEVSRVEGDLALSAVFLEEVDRDERGSGLLDSLADELVAFHVGEPLSTPV